MGVIPQIKYTRIRSVPVVHVLREDYCSLGKYSKELFSLARRFSIEYEKIIIASPVTYCMIIELGNRKIVCDVHLVEVHGILMYWKGPRTKRTMKGPNLNGG